MRTKIGAVLATLILAAPGAGLAACGEDDVEREATEAGNKAEKAAEDAKKEAEKAKEDAEDAVDGN
jgi:hypothetical protein